MQFSDYQIKPATIRAYQLTAANIAIVKLEGGVVFSLGLVEFISPHGATPVVGDYIVYTEVGSLPTLLLQSEFEEMMV